MVLDAFPCVPRFEELLAERGFATPTTSRWCYVFKRFAPKWQRALRRHLSPLMTSWRMDETYVRVKGSGAPDIGGWFHGATLDIPSPRQQDAPRQALSRHIAGRSRTSRARVLNTDVPPPHSVLRCATPKSQARRSDEIVDHQAVAIFFNNVARADHRAIKRRVPPVSRFRSFCATRRHALAATSDPYIRKAQGVWQCRRQGIGFAPSLIFSVCFAATSVFSSIYPRPFGSTANCNTAA